MDEKINVTSSRYQKIAIDIARNIAKGRYKNGERIYSRTTIASQYKVSPETARRAIALLADLEIVKTVKGSGVTILSQEKAKTFIERYTESHTVNQLKGEILEQIKFQQIKAKELENNIVQLLEATNRYQGSNPLLPVEISIHSNMLYLDKTISEINFWHNTGATVVAIQRESELLLSPGPYAQLMEGDMLMFIGDKEVYGRVEVFLYGNSEKEES